MKAAIDYETYYDKEISVKTQGIEKYIRDPKFDAYLMSIVMEDGFNWVGHPKDAPWEKLEGCDVLAHNRNFEEPLTELLIEQGVIPKVKFNSLQCTLDMSAYLGWGHNLKECCKNALGIEMDKDPRAKMSGRVFAEMKHEDQVDFAKYALYDSKACLQLGQKGMDLWPDKEKELSHETTRMCRQGLPMDVDMLNQMRKTLRNKISLAIETIPWTEIQKGAKSPIQWNAWCRERGKTPPKSMAKDNKEVLNWMKENPEEGAILKSVHDLGGSNGLLKKIETMIERVNGEGRLPFGIQLFGAYPTGRDTGKGGFNTQNMPRGELYGVNLRNAIKAPDGKMLLQADYGQIEARVCAYLAREWEMLSLAEKYDWYEAMARSFSMYSGESPMSKHDPETRHMVKQMCLGLQFKMGIQRFMSMTGHEYDDAVTLVRMFRAKMPGLSNPKTGLWSVMEKDMKRAGMSPEKLYEIELPSGRSLSYENVSVKGGLSAEILRNGRKIRLKYWAGMLIENAVQAVARDIFMDAVLRLSKAGHNIILRVHDEVLIEADKSSLKDEIKSIQNIMTVTPSWCKGLPLGTEVVPMERYTK